VDKEKYIWKERNEILHKKVNRQMAEIKDLNKKSETIFDLARRFPNKTYRELESYKDADRQKEAVQMSKEKTLLGHKIIDNFLPKSDLIDLQTILTDKDFDWYYIPDINQNSPKDSLGSYFVHVAYSKEGVTRHMHRFSPILSRLEGMKSLIRIKVNLYPRTPTLEVHAPHVDENYTHTGAIFSLNTCNGKTILEDGTEIDSVANRVLLFDASTPHSSTSTTDSKARFNININYD